MLFCDYELYEAFNFTGTQATRTYILSDGSAVFYDSYSLYVGSPFSFGYSMRMGYVVAADNTLTAYFTILCHR